MTMLPSRDAAQIQSALDQISGSAGLTTFPAGASPADTVSVAEVIRAIWGILNGTASGENGITTWPTAAAYGNNVSLAEALAYIQDGVRKGSGTGLGANESLLDVLYGSAPVTTFPAAALPATGKSVAAVLRENYDQSEKVAVRAAGVLVNGQTIFTIAGGPIKILELVAVCVTANDTTASTIQFSADGTDGAATTFTGASATAASKVAGVMLVCDFTALATAPAFIAAGVGLAAVQTNGIIVPAGIITTVVGVGSTTGTWTIHMRYKPLARGVTVA